MKTPLLSLFCFFVLNAAVAQKIWYVNPAASGVNNGSNWSDAFSDLGEALWRAEPGDAVWVARGVYLPTTGTDRGVSFAPKSGVKLYGGFTGTEKSPAERDMSKNETRLSGNIGDPLDSTDNAYTVLYLAYPDSNTLLDGLVFEHGYASSDTSVDNSSPVRSGGAVYIQASKGVALPTFRHCVFRHNAAAGLGGAVCVWADQTLASSPVFQYCTFFDNLCGFYGGVIYLSGGAPVDRGVEFDHCTFRNNRSFAAAGGIFIDKSVGSDVTDFRACVVTGHYAARWAGFLYYQLTAAVPLRGVRFDSCDFSKNFCQFLGGHIVAGDILGHGFGEVRSQFVLKNSFIHDHANPPAVSDVGLFSMGDYRSVRDTAWMENNVIHDNQIVLGIGISSGYGIIRNNIIYNNRRPKGGYCRGFTGSTSNCDIANNLYVRNEMAFTGVPSRNEPGTMYAIHDNLFINNVVPDSSGLYGDNNIIYSARTFNTNTGRYAITNNLFLGNQVFKRAGNIPQNYPFGRCENNIFLGNRNSVTGTLILPIPVEYDSIYIGHNLMDVDCATFGKRVACGLGNLLGQSPVFANARTGDYRLAPCSPGVDAGSNAAVQNVALDYEGKARIAGARVDMGPFENPWPFTKPRLALGGDTLTCPFVVDGVLTALVDSATAPFRYRWSNGATTASLSGLPAGLYKLTLTDAVGCVDSVSATVRDAVSLVVSAAIDKPSGATKADGRIVLQVTSGTGPFRFAWDTRDTTPTLQNLLPGTYTVTIVDAAGCGYVYAYKVEATSSAAEEFGHPSASLMYPNPAVSRVWLQWGDKVEWRLFSPNGQLLVRASKSPGASESSVELDRFPSGIYTCVWVDREGQTSQGVLTIR